jgi:hypothetical protein
VHSHIKTIPLTHRFTHHVSSFGHRDDWRVLTAVDRRIWQKKSSPGYQHHLYWPVLMSRVARLQEKEAPARGKAAEQLAKAGSEPFFQAVIAPSKAQRSPMSPLPIWFEPKDVEQVYIYIDIYIYAYFILLDMSLRPNSWADILAFFFPSHFFAFTLTLQLLQDQSEAAMLRNQSGAAMNLAKLKHSKSDGELNAGTDLGLESSAREAAVVLLARGSSNGAMSDSGKKGGPRRSLLGFASAPSSSTKPRRSLFSRSFSVASPRRSDRNGNNSVIGLPSGKIIHNGTPNRPPLTPPPTPPRGTSAHQLDAQLSHLLATSSMAEVEVVGLNLDAHSGDDDFDEQSDYSSRMSCFTEYTSPEDAEAFSLSSQVVDEVIAAIEEEEHESKVERIFETAIETWSSAAPLQVISLGLNIYFSFLSFLLLNLLVALYRIVVILGHCP